MIVTHTPLDVCELRLPSHFLPESEGRLITVRAVELLKPWQEVFLPNNIIRLVHGEQPNVIIGTLTVCVKKFLPESKRDIELICARLFVGFTHLRWRYTCMKKYNK